MSGEAAGAHSGGHGMSGDTAGVLAPEVTA